MPDATSALARKLGRFATLRFDEIAAIAALQLRRRRVAAGTEIFHEREARHRAFIVQDGWASSYKVLRDGGRQVIDFAVPGDFMGLRSVLLRNSDHAAAAVTDITIAEVSVPQMLDTFRRLPRLGTAVLWAASRDEATVVEHMVGIGRRDALSRTAHFFLEFRLRLQVVGLGSDTGYACPLSQYLLADALGLTAIHLNRVLRQLRERSLLTFRDGSVVFHDLAGLQRLSGYDGGYLDQGAV